MEMRRFKSPCENRIDTKGFPQDCLPDFTWTLLMIGDVSFLKIVLVLYFLFP